MNIFALSTDPYEAAAYQCDKHVVKMIVESAQMLSTAHRVLDGIPAKTHAVHNVNTDSWKLFLKNGEIHTKLINAVEGEYPVKEIFEGEYVWVLKTRYYLSAHENHPCSKWVRESAANYNWLYHHFLGLCYEYKNRYDKYHATYKAMSYDLGKLPENIPNCDMTPFALAMKDYPELVQDDPVESYRDFYVTKLDRMDMCWTEPGRIPAWFNERVAT